VRLPGIYRLRRAAKRLRNRFRPTALILLYHRIIDLPSDPQLLCVSSKHFAEHLNILKKYTHSISLQRLNQDLRNETLINRSVAITFDDGYFDNLQNAEPLLGQFGIPATIFVASGYIGSGREFWWDELERLLLRPNILPAAFRLSINGRTYQGELKEWATYGEDDYRCNQEWNILEKDDPTSRHRHYRTLCQFLRPLPDKNRREVLDELAALVCKESQEKMAHRILSAEEISRLDKYSFIEIGSHTVTHPVLSKLSPSEQRAEIRTSKIQLEKIVGHPIKSFAFPYGLKEDYTIETATLVQESGFEYACSNFYDIVYQGTDRFQLPRVLVRDWNGEEFKRRLEQWFLG